MGKIIEFEKFEGNKDPLLEILEKSATIQGNFNTDIQALELYEREAIPIVLELEKRNLCKTEIKESTVPYYIHSIYIEWNQEVDIEIDTHTMSNLFNAMNESVIVQENGDLFLTTEIYTPKTE